MENLHTNVRVKRFKGAGKKPEKRLQLNSSRCLSDTSSFSRLFFKNHYCMGLDLKCLSCTCHKRGIAINPLNPKSDQHLP